MIKIDDKYCINTAEYISDLKGRERYLFFVISIINLLIQIYGWAIWHPISRVGTPVFIYVILVINAAIFIGFSIDNTIHIVGGLLKTIEAILYLPVIVYNKYSSSIKAFLVHIATRSKKKLDASRICKNIEELKERKNSS